MTQTQGTDYAAQQAINAVAGTFKFSEDRVGALLRAITFIEKDSDLGQLCAALIDRKVPCYNVSDHDVIRAEEACWKLAELAQNIAEEAEGHNASMQEAA